MEEYFMCAVDFRHHLPDDPNGARVFASVDALRAARPCVAQCGIVAVKVEMLRWVQAENFGGDPAQD